MLAVGVSLLNDRRRSRRRKEPDYSAYGDDETSPLDDPVDLGDDSIDPIEPLPGDDPGPSAHRG
jgi:hypothetical protein